MGHRPDWSIRSLREGRNDWPTGCPAVSSWSGRPAWRCWPGWRLRPVGLREQRRQRERWRRRRDTIPLARLDNPVTLPDNGIEAVASGQEPESGHARGLQLRRLHQPRDDGGLRGGVWARRSRSPSTTPRTSSSPTCATTRSRSTSSWARRRCSCPKFVVGKLIQPLNQEYLPNFSNVLASAAEPVLRRRVEVHRRRTPCTRPASPTGATRSTTRPSPATTRGSCCGTRPTRASSASSTTRARRSRSACTTGASRTPTPATPTIIDAAEADIKALVAATDARFDILAYQKIPEGTSHINQAWSGDMVAAQYYLPEGTDAEVLGLLEAGADHGRQRLLRHPGPVRAAGAGPRAHRLPARSRQRAVRTSSTSATSPRSTSPTPDDLIAAELVPAAPAEHARSRDEDVADGFRLDALSLDVENALDGRLQPYPVGLSRTAMARGEGSKSRPAGPLGLVHAARHGLADRALPRPVLRHRRDRLRRCRPHLRLRASPLEPADVELHRRQRRVRRGRRRVAAQRLRAHLLLRRRSRSSCASPSATRSPTTWPATPGAPRASCSPASSCRSG